MPIYNLQISWKHSIETVELDTTALPRQDSRITTVESWTGESDQHEYAATVQKIEERDGSISLQLRYEQASNPQVANDSWGTSTIRLDLSKPGPTATAKWKDDHDSTYDGPARVAVTMTLTEAEELAADLADIERSAPETERVARILARIGQGRFRADVARAWKRGEMCPVTNIGVPELLVASHIVPWREASDTQRLDPANGLLLATHVDKLFDRHLLSFREEGAGHVLVLHPRIREAAGKLGIEEGASLPVEELGDALRARFAQHMRAHFSRFAEKVDAHNALQAGR